MTMNGDAAAVAASGIGISLTDPTKHAQVVQYVESLKKDENGWKKSVDNIITNNISGVEEHFVLLQVVEDFLVRRYAGESAACGAVRQLLAHWMGRLTAQPAAPAFLSNKMAHLFALVFAADFPNRWPEFIDEIFLSRPLDQAPFAIFYLRVLLAIDAEVVDRDIVRTKQVFDRNTTIKDAMREICIEKMAASWFDILERCQDGTAQSLCLDVIGAFVDWIDVELVANERFVPLMVQRLGNADTSESAVSCVCALVEKGMPAQKKLGMVTALSQVMKNNGLLTLTESSDEDDALRVGQLINSFVLQLVDSYQKLVSEGVASDAAAALSAVEGEVETMLRVLAREEPEASESVIDALKMYVNVIKNAETPERVAMLGRLVAVCLERYEMGEDLQVDGEGEDEIDFHEYRRQLRSLVNPIGTKHPELVVEPLERLVAGVCAGGRSVQAVEAVLQLVYSLSEMIPSNFVAAKEGWLGRAAALPCQLVEGLTLDGRAAAIHVLYFETACRYERILQARPQPTVGIVAAAFLDERGIAFRVERVRTRIVYLFCRFVKAHKTVLSPLVSQVIERLAPLLAVSPTGEQFLCADDQAFIYEATATLIVYGSLTPEQKAQYITELAGSLADKFSSGLSELASARSRGDAATAQALAQFLAALVGYASRMSKAFNPNTTMASCNCVDVFLRLLNIFLEALDSSTASFLLENTRQLAHRLVVCLNEELLALLPSLLARLAAASADLDSMHHLLLLAHQVVAKHKKAVLVSGVDFGAVLANAARFSVMELPPSATAQDEAAARSQLYVQRAFLQLLYSVVCNEILTVVAPGEQVDALLDTAVRLALATDQASQKAALSTLAKAAGQVPSWWERVVRTSLEVPAMPHLKPTDAGSSLVLHEAAGSLQSLRALEPSSFDQLVVQLMPANMGQQLVQHLSTLKGKELDKQLTQLYSALRPQQ